MYLHTYIGNIVGTRLGMYAGNCTVHIVIFVGDGIHQCKDALRAGIYLRNICSQYP